MTGMFIMIFSPNPSCYRQIEELPVQRELELPMEELPMEGMPIDADALEREPHSAAATRDQTHDCVVLV